jgi:hypothetical protein
MKDARAQHLDWLSLVDAEGQFLTIPVLREAFSAGLDEVPTEIRVSARERVRELEPANEPARDAWISWLLREALEWGDRYRDGSACDYRYAVPEYRTELRASGALIDPATLIPRLFVVRVPLGSALDEKLRGDDWNASPLERAALLAKAYGVRVALVTDGDRIALGSVPREGTGGHATWHTELFAEGAERTLFASFVSLLHARRFFNVVDRDTLEGLFARSALAQSELTKTLGLQVRRAVELLVAALSSIDRESDGRFLAAVPPHTVYEAAATVMMRLVFLLFAEERQLLPLADPLYARSYAISTLRQLLDNDLIRLGEESLERRGFAWRRVLATCEAVYRGIEHDRLRMPAYGGRLFDPRRYAFLGDARVDDLTIATILEALQTVAQTGGGRRRLSFRTLDVEQIGHVYEGLLDHDVRRVDEVVLGFAGKSGDEPEVVLSDLEAAEKQGIEALVARLVDLTGKTDKAVRKALDVGRALVSAQNASDARRRIQTACYNDLGLVSRVLPYAPFLRDDLHGIPIVYLPGTLVVMKTRARRDSGTEYTPRELAEEIVHYALEPLVYRPGPIEGAPRKQWVLRSSSELLALKVCDPACGSGAFVVAATRYLADRVAEAWLREEHTLDDNPTREAQRLVASRCVYGVDRDPMAVEMAKLSMWLLTFSRERPFGFLDHAIREGDSLLGLTSLDQIRALDRNADRGRAVHSNTLFDATRHLDAFVDRAAMFRTDLEALDLIDIHDAEQKAQLQIRAEEETFLARTIADAVVGLELCDFERPERGREHLRLELADRVSALLNSAADSCNEQLEALNALAQRNLNSSRPSDVALRVPLHWPLEFPEVFTAGGTFDAIIGNPPFMGGTSISGSFGKDYLWVLKSQITERSGGRTDLSAYFLRLASRLSPRFAFLCTNSIAQGDTREIAIEPLLKSHWRIVASSTSRPWPNAAAVQFAPISMARTGNEELSMFDGVQVPMISALLLPIDEAQIAPKRLAENQHLVFEGTHVTGTGFILSRQEAESILVRDPKSNTVVAPFLNAKDVCDQCDVVASRAIINFTGLTEDMARRFAECFRIIEERVKPERQRLRADGKYVLRSPLPQRWWLYNNSRPELYKKIASYREVIVVPKVSKYCLAMKVSANQVFSHALAVFASCDEALYGLLTSEMHSAWARLRGSTLETRFRYTPTDCFETLPLPKEWASIAPVMAALHKHRSLLMLKRNEGATITYNQLHTEANKDAQLETLRELHVELDIAVMQTYGWSDLNLEHGFRDTSEGRRFTISENARLEILDRLLRLNIERYANGSANEPPSTSGKMKSAAKRKPMIEEPALFRTWIA